MTANTSRSLLTPELFRLVYHSRITTLGLSQPDILNNIMKDSRSYNAKYGITGVVCYSNGYFFQYLEGSEKSLTNLKNKLLMDGRHSKFKILDFSQIDERLFEGWVMWSIVLENIVKENKELYEYVSFNPEKWKDDEWKQLLKKIHIYYLSQHYELNSKPMNIEIKPTKKSLVFYRVLKEQQGFKKIVEVATLIILIYIFSIYIVSII